MSPGTIRFLEGLCAIFAMFVVYVVFYGKDDDEFRLLEAIRWYALPPTTFFRGRAYPRLAQVWWVVRVQFIVAFGLWTVYCAAQSPSDYPF